MMRLPDIVGVNLTGRRAEGITATDIVLALTEFLRGKKVVGAWLEFFGEGADSLTIGDRATISNMCPEYGATAAMFYIDQQTLDYLRLTTLQRPGAQGVPFFFVRDIRHASRLVYSQGLNLADLSAATLIGAGCKVCERPACPQRAFPPIGRPLVIDPNRSAATPYPSAALQ